MTDETNSKFLIPERRSIIIAIDDYVSSQEIIETTRRLKGVGGYKVGAVPILQIGTVSAQKAFRKRNWVGGKPVIYDHQKAGTDTPYTAEGVIRSLYFFGGRTFADAVILFPLAGAETERAWIRAARDRGLGVIVGGLMSHPGFLASEGGFIADDKVREMYRIAIEEGVREFVIPAPIKRLHLAGQMGILDDIQDVEDSVFYAVGIGPQGGSIEQVGQVLGKDARWHAIIGRGITDEKSTGMRMEDAAKMYIDQMNSLD